MLSMLPSPSRSMPFRPVDFSNRAASCSSLWPGKELVQRVDVVLSAMVLDELHVGVVIAMARDCIHQGGIGPKDQLVVF